MFNCCCTSRKPAVAKTSTPMTREILLDARVRAALHCTEQQGYAVMAKEVKPRGLAVEVQLRDQRAKMDLYEKMIKDVKDYGWRHVGEHQFSKCVDPTVIHQVVDYFHSQGLLCHAGCDDKILYVEANNTVEALDPKKNDVTSFGYLFNQAWDEAMKDPAIHCNKMKEAFMDQIKTPKPDGRRILFLKDDWLKNDAAIQMFRDYLDTEGFKSRWTDSAVVVQCDVVVVQEEDKKLLFT
jgi:hypothetical protein